MLRYKARYLLTMPHEELWALKDGPIEVEFDDGVLLTTVRKTIFSVYLQEFQRRFPKTPLLKDRHHIGNNRLDANTHLNLLGAGLWDAYDAYNGELDIEELSRIAYEITNRVYNDFTYQLERFVSSISILDFLDVLDHPKVAAANAAVRPTVASISNTYDAIEAVLKDPNELKGNGISKVVRSRLVSLDQTLQCVGPRGYLSDIDSTIFPHPILTGYTEGLVGHYELLIESRSAARALLFSKDPIRESEYLNRQLQLLCGTFRRVHGVSPQLGDHNELLETRREWRDCGSQVFRPFAVKGSDLESLSGKYYRSTDGSLKAITVEDRHLIGKTIGIRSIYDCLLPDRHGVCATCFGDLALSIPGYTNVGHLSASILGEIISQNLLSTKHLERSSDVDVLPLSDYDQRYIRLGVDTNTIRLSPELQGRSVRLLIRADEAKNLSTITRDIEISELTIARVTEISDVTLLVSHRDRVEVATVPVSIGSRKSSFNHALLEYLKTHGWELGEGDYEGYYVIDLKDWDRNEPLMSLALRNINTVDFMKEIERVFKSTDQRQKGGPGREHSRPLSSYSDPWQALVAFYEFVSSRLRINLAHLEVVVYCTTAINAQAMNYDLPRFGETFEIERFNNIMSMRSLSVLLAFQSQTQAIYNPLSYMITDRPSHPMDALIVGQRRAM